METKTPDTTSLSPSLLLQQSEAFLAHLRRKWMVLALAGLGFGIIGWLLSLREDTLFQAELSFALDEKEPGQAQSAFSLFSQQLGLEPVDGGNAFSTTRNIEELLKSRLLIEKTLRSSFVKGKDSVYFYDYFLDSLDLRTKWAPGSTVGMLNEKKQDAEPVSVLEQNALIKSIYKKIAGSYLGIQQKTKGTSILTVSLTTPHEGFSKHFLERLVAEVSAFYIDAKTRRSKTNLTIIEQRNDSVRNAFQQAIRQRAATVDADINLVREVATAPTEKMQADVQILKSAYTELSRNLETAKTAVMNETPIIEIIDLPLLPLDKKSPAPLRNFLLFFALGVAISVVWLAIRWILSIIRGESEDEQQFEGEYV
jgi:hypothetical protein